MHHSQPAALRASILLASSQASVKIPRGEKVHTSLLIGVDKKLHLVDACWKSFRYYATSLGVQYSCMHVAVSPWRHALLATGASQLRTE
eukprot:5314-Eustigmatos_ZCMA.PRE.1